MDNIIADFFIQGVDAFITALIVSFLVVLMSQQQTMAGIVSENHNNAAMMQEYREYNAYDHKHVYASDIVSLIMKTKGWPEVKVTTTSGNYTFNISGHSLEYKAAVLSEKIDPNKLYDAEVSYEDQTYHLGVKSIKFTPCTSNGNCGR